MSREAARIRMLVLVLAASAMMPAMVVAQAKKSLPGRSTTIALARKDKLLVVVNRDKNTVSLLQVRKRSQDIGQLLAEVAVGGEPRCVAIGPKDREAFITDAASGAVYVIALEGPRVNSVVAVIPVGTEPRGCATSPSRKLLFVANQTAGSVSVIDTRTKTVVDTVDVGGRPTAIAVTNDGDRSDSDETVFVTDFYAELIAGGPGEGFDDGKQGVVHFFSAGSPRTADRLTLSPLANVGFTGDRSQFCTQFTLAGPQRNLTPANDTFCPDTTENDPEAAVIAADPQGAFPNQLASILIRGNRAFVPNVGAGPEPPVRFNVNVQALVHVFDTQAREEVSDLHVNLNDQIKAETQPDPAEGSLERLFGNDVVAIDANAAGTDFLIVSRGGNYVVRAAPDDDGKLTLNAPNVVRFQTGNLPNGVVITHDGRRAYVNNEANVSVTAIDLVANTVLARDIAVGAPPEPGTFAHAVLVGKLAFFTALGVPDDGLFDLPIRDIEPVDFRNKASDNGWSGCGSCHPDGLSDNVTWIFGTGPRNTVPLDGFFAKDNPGDQRISNYSAVMGSITDFNNNSRNVQGGIGFAGDPPNPNIFQHGFTQGASDALDAMTLWVQTVRAPIMPAIAASDVTAGRAVFEDNCASCHGGAKWTKSQVVYLNNPTFDSNPAAGGLPLQGSCGAGDNPCLTNAGPQIVSFTVGANTLTFLENVDTFNAASPIEIRSDGQGALGGLGFNVPSVLGIAFHAPFFHDGSAQTFADVFGQHALGGGTIASTLNAAQEQALTAFLGSIDGRTDAFASATDAFKDLLTP
jgi:YVTN family beta-propeller protein